MSEKRLELLDGSILVQDADLADYPDAHVFERNGDYLYCILCKRAYPRNKFRIDVLYDLMMCPYPDCEGDYNIDGWEWKQYRENCDDSFMPEIPIEGVRY